MIQIRPKDPDLQRLKLPLGQLLPGPPSQTMLRLKLLVEKTKPPFVTAVGDVVSIETQSAGIQVNLRIVDHRSMRKTLNPSEFKARTVSQVTNPAGVITQESWNAIKRALRQRDALILVDGEEDLLALPCIVESPDNSLVLYGQPSEGLVVVNVSAGVKAEVNGILGRAYREEV